MESSIFFEGFWGWIFSGGLRCFFLYIDISKPKSFEGLDWIFDHDALDTWL